MKIKKLNLFVLFLVLFGMSCTKIEQENTEKERLLQESKKTSSKSYTKTYYDEKGNQVYETDFEKKINFCIVPNIEKSTEENLVYTYFETEENAYEFYKDINNYKDFINQLDKIRKLRALSIKTGDIYIENPTNENISEEMKTLLNTYNTTNKTDGLVVLFDGYNGTGSWIPAGNHVVSLFGFNNRASSFRNPNLAQPPNGFYSRTWWRGSSYWVWHFFNITAQFTNFPHYMDNNCESIF